ncbi:inositol hexakisphosphate and diphosphoinositol-pentakisphosphate kinase 2 isoform X5 [Harmonia axyridis]|uniref:inositol hexakisphosphate and diphosphoinositol-pentakisphosphate kinase 2 isoform X5 n=1 Tax=Harmonia axyridis TaxID=115357 RepID=UPI001E277803|nr:inositol hexakisphosphate and diphosphoinositol-pentakisphosphate kinase 2 isoform X5 [Harmonia axyridis]
MSYTELEHGYQGLRNSGRPTQFYVGAGDIELCGSSDNSLGGPSLDDEEKVVIVGVCAMSKKSQSKPMKEILTRLQEFEYIKVTVFPEDVILNKAVEEWPVCDCLISFHSKGFPLDKAIQYAQLHNPYVINNLHMQYDIQDRRKVYSILESEGIEIPRYAVLDRDSPDPKHHELVESEDHVEVNGIVFNKPFVEKPVSAEDHNIYIYYPTSAGGGSQRLFRKIGSRSSVYSPESRVRKTGSYIYEDFMPTDGTDVKVYTVGPDYAHAEARKSPALDGKVERDREGKEIRYPVILNNAEKLISRKVCLAFKQAVCGFDLLRANGKSFVCDVNGFSFVKNSNKYYDDCAKILGNMILRELAPTLHIPWSVPFQLDDPPIVPTTFGKMMELRCVVGVIRHGDRTPKQKMKVEVRHPKFFEIFEKYDGYKHGHVKLKRPKQLQEILDIARSLLAEIQQHEADPEIEEKQGKLEQLKGVLEMYGHFSGINRKVQMKYQPKGRPRGSSSDDDKPAEPSLVLILKWGGELTPAGRIQAEELGRIFRCMYPGGQGRHLAGEYSGAQGLGLLRLHSTFRHDLKIYASDEGRVQMTAAAFAKGLLALEGELTPILVQMVKSANTNGLLDNDCDSSKYQNMCKSRLHELMQLDRDFTQEDRDMINPCNSSSIAAALEFVKNPVKCCKHVHSLIKSLMEIVQIKKDDSKTKDAVLYHGETWELMGRRWGKIEKDFFTKNKTFDISKIPDIYDCIKYDLQHNQHTLQFEQAEELYLYAKYLADIVIPQEYGLSAQEKLTIGQGICTPLLKKVKADLQRNIEENEETVNRLNPRYSHGVSSPGRHVRTRLYFTSESHVHSLITVLRHGGLLDITNDEQWRRAMEYVSMVSELNYMSQVVIMLYEDPTKDPSSEERFHVELHFSPGVNCCVQKNLPPGPGFRPHSRNESSSTKSSSSNNSATPTPPEDAKSQCSLRIDEESESTLDEDKPTSKSSVETLESKYNNSLFSPINSGNRKYRVKTSDPIPIGNSHTVCGHEAAHLAKKLNEELAQQGKRKNGKNYMANRTLSPDPEPRSKSYDNKSPKKEKEQSEDDQSHISLPQVPIIIINPPNSPNVKARPKLVSQRSLSSTSTIDLDTQTLTDINSQSKPQSSTNELPLTELNLEIFTSNQKDRSNSRMSTNELPMSDITFRPRSNTFYAEEIINKFDNECKFRKYKQRSFSDPNILDKELVCCSDGSCWLEKNNDASTVDENILEGSADDSVSVCLCDNLWFRRAPSTLLSFLTSPPNTMYPKQVRSTSQPSSPGVTSNPCMSYTESNSSPEKRHRHSIAGQMNYFRVIQTPTFGWDCPFPFKRTTLGSTNSLFSTAVISGSSSAPNLRDMIPSATSVSGLEGFGGVPPIRPLETLHNALSLRQIDTFLDRMTKASFLKTPSSTPPKYPSTPLPTPVGSQSTSTTLSSLGEQPLKSPCNSGVWSGPPSYVSSSGQSSPGLSETNSKESSDLSSSAISYDGLTMDNISKIFPNMAAELDEDLGNVRIQLDSQQKSQEDELLEYFGRYNLEEIESTTPISDPEIVLSKKEFPENKVLDIEHMFNNAVPDKGDNLSINSLKSNNITNNENKYQDKAASPVNLQSQHPTDWYLKLKTNHNKGQMEKNKITSYNSSISEINCTLNSKISTSGLGSDKWVSEKEKFLENSTIKNENYVDNTNRKENQKLGAVMIKESFIELPRIGRISRSFHGKSPSKDSYLEIDSTPRRASDNMVNLTSTFLNSKPLNLKNMDLMQGDKSKHTRPKFCTQKSQPCPVASKEEFRKSSLSDPQNLKGARFTTTIVDESAFMENFKSNSKNNK